MRPIEGEPPAPVHIRRATAADLAGWIALRDGLAEDDPEALARARRLVGDPARVAFVAEVDGASVGVLDAVLHRHWGRCPRRGPAAVIEGLYVAPRWRYLGIATALRDALAAWARGEGARCLFSDVDLANQEAQAWHRAVGFDEVERVVAFCQPLEPGVPACH